MVEQLLRLREVTELPNVTVRVLPLEVALECDPGGRFYVFEFPPERNGRHREPPVVYTDNLAGALYLEKPAELKSYLGVWQNMVDNSLSHADSLDLIKSMVGRYQQ